MIEHIYVYTYSLRYISIDINIIRFTVKSLYLVKSEVLDI